MSEERREQELLEMLAELPREAEASRALWPVIAARLESRPVPEGVLELGARRAGSVRRVSFSIPQLIAAGLVLASVSGGVVGAALSRMAPDAAVLTQGEPTIPALMAADTYQAYDEAVEELETILASGRQVLAPGTVLVLEESLAEIDEAIEDARAALAADPASQALNRALTNNMRKKLDVLRHAAGIIQSTT
jgi:hypothetical protein